MSSKTILAFKSYTTKTWKCSSYAILPLVPYSKATVKAPRPQAPHQQARAVVLPQVEHQDRLNTITATLPHQ